MIYATFLILALVPAWRTLLYWLFSNVAAAQGILLLGTSPTIHKLAEAIAEKPHLGIKVTGYIAEDECASHRIDGVECSGTLPQLKEIIAARKPGRLVVGVRKDTHPLPLDELLELRYQGLPVESAAAVYEQTLGRVRVEELEPSTLIFSSDLGPRPRSILLQSIYSFVLALIGLIVLTPVMLIVALLVRVTSSGPVLFRQTRVGLRDRVFTLYKFRSMYADAEARTGAVWATKNDSRITPLGKYLRRLRLDELPQLINVIKGDMAICGPRPERPEFVGMLAEKIPFYRQRHCVKPGITGWAQINHKYGDTVEDTVVKLEYDFYYIKHLDPALDFYIMFQTLKVMVLFRGAQ
jgi:exopolysaccharide biosynthesis polyprenyl glycosylphosphotransferase